MLRKAFVLALCAMAAYSLSQNQASAQGWGTVSGEVVWAGAALPKVPAANVNKDQEHCLSKGAIEGEKYVINPKNNGVRWVMVWLVDGKDPKTALPIHPSLIAIKDKEVVLDQPCCKFEPHVAGIREGQTLVTKNSSPIAHNVSIVSTGKNPNTNQIIPAGKQVDVDSWFSGRTPSRIECTIHPWMGAYVWAFNHPYFAVTDADGKFTIKNAPAGNFNLVVWQEETGFVQNGRAGIPVKIVDGAIANVKVQMK